MSVEKGILISQGTPSKVQVGNGRWVWREQIAPFSYGKGCVEGMVGGGLGSKTRTRNLDHTDNRGGSHQKMLSRGRPQELCFI